MKRDNVYYSQKVRRNKIIQVVFETNYGVG